MKIGIEEGKDGFWVVVDFDDGERAVNGPYETEETAQLLVDGMLAELEAETGEQRRQLSAGGGTMSPSGSTWVMVGWLITIAFLFALLWTLLR